MTQRDSDEQRLGSVVTEGLKRWLGKARDMVMAPWREHKLPPNPTLIYASQPSWNSEVDTILTEIGKIALGAWSRATDVPPVSRHAFVVAHLAQVKSLLVRIPDEVANQIFAEISDTLNGGGSTQDVAQAVDNILTWTGSENWPNRAKVIAVTEVTRAYGAATAAAGMEQSRVTGKMLKKRWLTEGDKRVRPAHRAVNGTAVPLTGLFPVGTDMLLYPGDPFGSPDNVIGCRCDLEIVDG
jgi:F like protein